VRQYAYFTDDTLTTVFGTGYFSDGYKHGIRLGDIIDVFVGTINTVVTSTSPTTAAAGALSEFSALSAYTRVQVSVANSTTFAVTAVSVPQQVAPTSQSLFSLWGATASTQPTSANEADISASPSVSISATQWGYTTSTQATGIVTLLRQLRTDLVAIGAIKGS
jgi:hypothetical protein